MARSWPWGRGRSWRRCRTRGPGGGRVYPLACLIAVALRAFTAAGNDRLTAVRQWIKRASQQDLARLRAPWDPMAGRHRAPDAKTIRVVLDRLDPRALLGPAGPAPRPGGAGAGPRPVNGGGRGRQDLPRSPPRRWHPVHLLGVAEHGGRLLDHLEVDVKHNETSHFTELLGPLDLAGAVVAADALHTVRGASPRDVTFGEDAATAAPAAGRPTLPPSAPPSLRPSKTPATCTSPKDPATIPPPPKPSASTASIKDRCRHSRNAGVLGATPGSRRVVDLLGQQRDLNNGGSRRTPPAVRRTAQAPAGGGAADRRVCGETDCSSGVAGVTVIGNPALTAGWPAAASSGVRSTIAVLTGVNRRSHVSVPHVGADKLP